MDPNQKQMMSRSFPIPMWPSDDLAAAAPPFPNRGWKRKIPGGGGGGGGYQPPALGELQVQNRAKARRWFNPNPNPNHPHRKPFHFFRKPKAAAPRNTTSFIIRAKRAGGIASLVSPSPVTPAVLPTPRLSPSREGLADMAQAQWGVDGYGSMKGLIRLRRSPHHPDDDDDPNSSDSDVEEHVEVERRLDHDLSRFEMVYPGRGSAGDYDVLEDDDEYDQDAHVARLEEENLTLKERLYLMEQEVGDMRRRLEALEARFSGPNGAGGGADNVTAEEALENDMDRGDMVSEKSSEDNVDGAHADGSDKSRENNAEKGAMRSEESGENNNIAGRGDAAAGSDKSIDDNGEQSRPDELPMN